MVTDILSFHFHVVFMHADLYLGDIHPQLQEPWGVLEAEGGYQFYINIIIPHIMY